MKLFRILVDRGLPSHIIRVLINMYVTQQACVSWAGIVSAYFPVLNGVRQGGVLSPLLFCVYIDNLLLRLSSSGVGCYMGANFVGALAYADDIVLLSPTPTAARKLLCICETFASEYDIKFNVQKSKLLVALPRTRQRQTSYLKTCSSFSIDGNLIERVESFSHLGHIITSSLSDQEDIYYRRNCFISQVNNMLCCFGKLTYTVKTRLFQAYCNSQYMVVNCGRWMTAE